MTEFFRDLRFGTRMLFKNPGLTAAAGLALALGIGLTAMMFSIVEGSVLKSLPFERAERLMHLETNNLSKGRQSLEVYAHDFWDWREQQTSFEGLAGFYTGTVNLSGTEKPERFNGAFISANAFEMLRARPLIGRTFREGEDLPGAEPVVILGHDVWKNRYGSDPGILGQSVRMNAKSATVVGVMPEGFKFPLNEDVWAPLPLDPAQIKRGEGMTLEVFGRLKDGVSLDQARLEFATLARRLEEAYPETNQGVGSVIKPYTEEFIGDEISAMLFTMLGAVGLVLLIACANVTNLLLARTAARGKEVAIRSALGASRMRVVRQLLAESLMVAAAGAVLGVGLAYLGIHLFNAAIDDVNKPYWIHISLNGTVLLFAIGITAFAGLVSGILPAWQASRADVNSFLKDESRGSSSFRMGRLSKGLVVAELALSCGLLVGAGLMIKSVVNLRTVDYGIESKNVLTARMGLFETSYPAKADQAQFYERLHESLQALPGVQAAALTTSLPVTGSWGNVYRLEGQTYEDDRLPELRYAIVTPGFFDVFGVKLREGRDFGSQDREGSLPVAIVNESFARKAWPGESPLGKRVRLGRPLDGEQPWRTVVGVVPDMRMNGLGGGPGSRQSGPEGLYVPVSQDGQRFMSMTVRTHGPPMAITQQVRDAVVALDKDTPLYWVWTMEEAIARSGWFYNVFGSLFVIFGAVALFLAAVGLYGVMAFSVRRRTQEIGVRMALGAQGRDVLGLILRQGTWQIGIGLALGLVLAWTLSRLLGFILFEVNPRDPTIFVGITLTLATVGLLACLIPARRAARVDPIRALHHE
jgi:putative ABC transport system permease protein